MQNRFLNLNYNIDTKSKETGFDKDEIKNFLALGNLSENEIAVAFLLSPCKVLAIEGISVPKNLMLHFLSKTTLKEKCVDIFKREDVNTFLEEALQVFFINYKKNYIRDAYSKHEFISDDASESLFLTVKKLIESGIEIPDSTIELLTTSLLFPEDRKNLKTFLNNRQ